MVKFQQLVEHIRVVYGTIATKIDELVALTARGFEEVDKKFNQNDKMHQIFADELQFVRSDINGLKINTSDELKSHNFRLNRLERKVGVVPLKD